MMDILNVMKLVLFRPWRLWQAPIIACILASLLVGGVAHAADTIARTFKVDDKSVVTGALVSGSPGDSTTAELATNANAEKLLGVVSETPLLVLGQADASTVKVATSGLSYALVSDINGAIQAGDKITVSPIAGVGMKATEDGMVVGVAEETANLAAATTRTIQGADGADRSVRITLTSIRVGVGSYTVPDKSFVPAFIQRFANNLAGHDVSPIRIVLAGFIALLLIGSVIAIIYASVRSSIISIGRNPLAASSVQRGLIKVIFGVIVVSAAGIAAIYMTLTL